MRISYWSSDVCSSDLVRGAERRADRRGTGVAAAVAQTGRITSSASGGSQTSRSLGGRRATGARCRFYPLVRNSRHDGRYMSRFALPETAHPVMQAGLAYWQAAAPEPDLLPGRQHIDPAGMPTLLPHVWLMEILPPLPDTTVPRLRFRLVGSHVEIGRAHV